MDYTQFDKIVKAKRKKGKFLVLDSNESAELTLSSLETITRQNNFSGEIEDAWLAKLKDDEGNEKMWTFTSLSIFNQFKDKNIQEEDLIRITKQLQSNGKHKYIVENLAPEEDKKTKKK